MANVDAEPRADIEAAALVPAPPEDVFAFLSDLRNHWRLADRFVEVLTLEASDGERADGGRGRGRGPPGRGARAGAAADDRHGRAGQRHPRPRELDDRRAPRREPGAPRRRA